MCQFNGLEQTIIWHGGISGYLIFRNVVSLGGLGLTRFCKNVFPVLSLRDS